jgi:hypothetical protein
MATKNMAYDHPQYVVRQAAHIKLPATAASTSVAKFLAFTAMKIKSVNTIVGIAGTSTNAGWDFLNGTSSVGGVVVGTSVAVTVGAESQFDTTLASGGYLDIKTKAESATLAGDIMIEYEFVPGANVSA